LDELIGRSLGCLVHPDDRERVLDISRRRQSGQPAEPRYDYKGVKKDGSAIYVAVSATTINYHNRILSLAYLRDVTSRRMAEEEIHFLSRRLIESIEEERRRLAADLHDEFGQSLTALHLGVESIRRTLEKDRPELARTCDKMVSSIENLAENIRGVAGRLRPDMLDHLGLVASMEWYVDEYRQGLPDSVVSFRAVGFVGRRRLDPQFEIVLYRVFQEALTNAAKHARAGRVDVRLTYSHPNVILVITDDGRGFDQGEIMGPGMRPRRGIGLISMKERVAAAGGTIDVRSAPGRGTAIRVTLNASAPPRTPASGRTP
jgi:signal transduction histidine kinase